MFEVKRMFAKERKTKSKPDNYPSWPNTLDNRSYYAYFNNGQDVKNIYYWNPNCNMFEKRS